MFCMKLIKWSALGLAGAAAATFFVFGEHTGSYISTMTSSVRDNVRGKIPMNFELKRAERLVADIEPQIQTCKRDVARAEVELTELDAEIEAIGETVVRDERKLKAGRDVLVSATGSAVYELAGRQYDKTRVELDMMRTLEAHRANLNIFKSKKALRTRQAEAVEAARTRLDAVRAQKSRLEDQIASLKVQKQQLDAMAASSTRFDLDDSALSKAKEVLARVKKELDIAQKVIEDDIFHADGIAVAMPEGVNVVQEIEAFFAETEQAPAKASTGLHIVEIK